MRNYNIFVGILILNLKDCFSAIFINCAGCVGVERILVLTANKTARPVWPERAKQTDPARPAPTGTVTCRPLALSHSPYIITSEIAPR